MDEIQSKLQIYTKAAQKETRFLLLTTQFFTQTHTKYYHRGGFGIDAPVPGGNMPIIGVMATLLSVLSIIL
jgi:hypothetical protein